MTVDGLVVIFAGGLFVIVTGLLSWIGTRVHSRLDQLTEMLDKKLTAVGMTLSIIERDLRGDLAGLRGELVNIDRRTSQLEFENQHRRVNDGK